MTENKEKLTKKELNQLWNRYMWSYNSSASFERFHAIGWVYSLFPLFKKYYNNKKSELIEAMKRHSVFFNTEAQLGSLIFGIIVALEEQKAMGKDIDEEVIKATKLGLMGPVAGVGDSMIPGVLIPILLSIAMALSVGGSIVGPIFYIVSYTGIVIFCSKFLFLRGYKLGFDSIDLIIGEKAGKLRDAIIMLGVVVMGGVAASYVELSTKLQFASGKEMRPLQGMLDGIFPKLLPLALVLTVWALMSKKKISPLLMIMILVAFSFVCAFFKII